jgi:hypothetical protein
MFSICVVLRDQWCLDALMPLRPPGTPAARLEAKSMVKRSRNGLEAEVDVVVTTYTYFERESSGDDRKFFRGIDWDYLVDNCTVVTFER